MNIVERLNKHPIIFLIFLLGSIASIVGLVVIFVPNGTPEPPSSSKNTLQIESVRESKREPEWGSDAYSDDEIIAVVNGYCSMSPTDTTSFKLVGFWRLASDFETNWHIAKRRVGGNYQLAMLDGESAVAGNWDFPD